MHVCMYLYCIHSSITNLQHVLQQISSWMTANLLTLNSAIRLNFLCPKRDRYFEFCFYVIFNKCDGSWVTYQMGQWVMGQFQ